MNKILSSTKELLGIPEEVIDFDSQLVIHINSVFTTLNQLGVGPTSTYQTSPTEGNLDEFGEGIQNTVQMYIYIKVRLVFDPPASSPILAALQKTAEEYEFRLMTIKE